VTSPVTNPVTNPVTRPLAASAIRLSVLAVLTCAMLAPAWAQQTAPEPAPPEPAPSTTTRPVPPPVAVQALGGIDSWGVGTLAAAEAPLPATLWRGSDARAVGAAMERITTPVSSPALQRLLRRVVLSAGTGPTGDTGAHAARTRATLALRLGEGAAAARIAARLPDARTDESVRRLVTNAQIAAGALNEACGGLDTLSPTDPATPRMRAL